MLNSSVSLLTAIGTGIVVFFFTKAWVSMKGAREGHAKAKAAVPSARKSMRSAIGSLFKVGVLAAILVLILFAWVTSDLEDAADEKPGPSPSVRRT